MSTRIRAIHDAAVSLFLRQGYATTQISHIAKVVGVSVGTIYHDFAGKQEIRNFVLKCAITPGYFDRNFERPITNELFAGLHEEITATFRQTARAFAAHLENGAAGYSFEELVADAFDLLAQYAVGCLYIEKNLQDCGRLADHYRDYRKQFFHSMTRYMAIFMEQGVIRPLDHLELSANLVIEILSWWAMDMRFISFEARDTPLELAKEICLDNILHAYKR